jgi:uncharacterized protein (TIGR02246 family)
MIMSQPTLEERIARLEDIEAIRQLKAMYCFHCDNGYDAERLAELFTEDAVWVGGGRGTFEGRSAIREFFRQPPKDYPYAAHLVTNPVIEVNGHAATGLWHLLEPCNVNQDGTVVGRILSSRYEDVYRRDHGRWLIHRLKVTHHRITFEGNRWVA